MISRTVIWALFLIFSAATGQEPVARAPLPVRVTLCELAKAPENYAGKMIEIRARITGYSEPVLDDFSEKESCATHFTVILANPDDVKPRAKFDLVRDYSLDKFHQDLQHAMTVEATLEGRFDTVFELKEGKQVRTGKGYGKEHDAEGRLVLRRITKLEAWHIERR
ncbi:MAG: hypothetical protein ACRD50_15155 [Candidatus Acidiferrales bacterium]